MLAGVLGGPCGASGLVVNVLHLDSMLMVQEQLVVDKLLLLLWLLLLLQNFPNALTSGACKNRHDRLRVCGSKLRNRIKETPQASTRPADLHWTCLTAQTAASPNAIELPNHDYRKNDLSCIASKARPAASLPHLARLAPSRLAVDAGTQTEANLENMISQNCRSNESSVVADC